MKPENEYAGSPQDISDMEKAAGNEWTLSGDVQVWELIRDNLELKRRLRVAVLTEEECRTLRDAATDCDSAGRPSTAREVRAILDQLGENE